MKYATSAVFGMACFDHHRAVITIMHFTGHSLPVHQFVTVPWDFNPAPYCQPRSPTPMEYATSVSLEWHVWPGRRSVYYISAPTSIDINITFMFHSLFVCLFFVLCQDPSIRPFFFFFCFLFFLCCPPKRQILCYSLRFFQTIMSWWSFTWVCMSVSLLKSPGLFSVFWPILIML